MTGAECSECLMQVPLTRDRDVEKEENFVVRFAGRCLVAKQADEKEVQRTFDAHRRRLPTLNVVPQSIESSRIKLSRFA